MKRHTGFITLFTVSILILPLQAEAVWWKFIRNMAVKSIATEMLKEGASKKQIQNICVVIATSFAYTYSARINGTSRETWTNTLN
jgi:hypothetical protein